MNVIKRKNLFFLLILSKLKLLLINLYITQYSDKTTISENTNTLIMNLY
jgi:hypothetical protein